MGKLPSTLLLRPRAIPSSSSSLLSSSFSSHLPIKHAHALPSPSCQLQVRHATFVPRPRRPYQFAQLVQLSDGSTFTVRTTAPTALLKPTKDSRNHILWQPSEKSLKNLEVDEAGKLAAFRERFGRGWDMESGSVAVPLTGTPAAAAGAVQSAPVKGAEEVKGAKGGKEKKKGGDTVKAAETQAQTQTQAEAPAVEEDPFDSLTDLISSYAKVDDGSLKGKTAKESAKDDKRRR